MAEYLIIKISFIKFCLYFSSSLLCNPTKPDDKQDKTVWDQ